jgi:hypothetical protein
MNPYRLSFRNVGWRGRVGFIVAAALGIAVTIAVSVLSLGLALVLLPIVAIAFFIGRWRLRKLMAAAEADLRAQQRERAGDPPGQRTIETDYSVIDEERR